MNTPKKRPTPINVESPFKENEIIVSKTDLKGRITYANDIFCKVSEADSVDQVLGKPHSLIRHPDMPRAIFKYLWDTLAEKKEVFAYVKNMSLSGKYYWVLANVTPSLDTTGNIIGYHSNRRKPSITEIKTIEPIYKNLIAEEVRHSNKKTGLEASSALLKKILEDEGKSYDEFIWSVIN